MIIPVNSGIFFMFRLKDEFVHFLRLSLTKNRVIVTIKHVNNKEIFLWLKQRKTTNF